MKQSESANASSESSNLLLKRPLPAAPKPRKRRSVTRLPGCEPSKKPMPRDFQKRRRGTFSSNRDDSRSESNRSGISNFNSDLWNSRHASKSGANLCSLRCVLGLLPQKENCMLSVRIQLGSYQQSVHKVAQPLGLKRPTARHMNLMDTPNTTVS